MTGDAAARIRANEAVFEQAWGTISTMAYDPLAGVRFDGRFNAREWTARKKTAFSVDARRFETPAGTRAEIETLLDAIDDRWAAYDPPPAERPPRASSPLDDVAVCVEIKILRRVRAESPRRPPRHRRDACSMAWRCRFITTRQRQNGRVIVVK